MQTKIPKNTNHYFWTEHVKFKMRFYGLSEQKVLSVISSPKRKEEGIVEKTIAVMKPVSPKIVSGKEVWKQEVWVMFQKHKACNMKHVTKIPACNAMRSIAGRQNSKIKIISAWRYPGVSPEKNPIPEEILRELLENS
ncbi:MAG: hypothetical protein NTY33_00260 [Candidatus Moranbacteria bacterium]|nr:hypothetical protein [Candidatus Moranbacteria bacterium]